MITGTKIEATIPAAKPLLKGGYEPEFGIALSYAALVTLISFGLWWWLRGQANRIDSGLVRLDVKAWLLSALMGSALLLAFAVALTIQGTAAEHLLRFIDPLALALIALVLLPMPFREARESFAEILQISPSDLDAHLCSVMADFVQRHGFLDYRSYLAKTGRARFIEISVLVPPDLQLPVTEIDALRNEIGRAIGGAGPDRWLTITFTADPAQL